MEASTYIAVSVLAVLSGLTTILGVLLAIYVSRSTTWIAVGIGFSVGIMLLIALFEKNWGRITVVANIRKHCDMDLNSCYP